MSSGIARWGGWAGMVAAVMFVFAGVGLILIAPPQSVYNSFSDYLIEIFLVVAFALTLVAIVGFHALQRGRYGRLGAVGSLITLIGYALTGTPRSHDPIRTGTAMVVWCAAHRRLPPRRCFG